MSKKPEVDERCAGCVYYPPNLPSNCYSAGDWQILQALDCAHEHLPGSQSCLAMRKTHCELVDLRRLQAGQGQIERAVL